jgi:hypothetical protein
MCGDMKAFERLPGESLLELEASLGILATSGGQQMATTAADTTNITTDNKRKGPKVTASGKGKTRLSVPVFVCPNF